MTGRITLGRMVRMEIIDPTPEFLLKELINFTKDVQIVPI